MTYKAHYLVPVVYKIEAANDDEAAAIADQVSLRTLRRYGDFGYPDIGCDALIVEETDRTVFEI